MVEHLLAEPWVLDTDVTIKPLYGRQEGAVYGFNPKKPGRPSHAYHTYWLARVRLCLDVEVRPGNEHGVNYGLDGLFAWLDARPREHWPQFMRRDCGYGQETVMASCEARQLGYLFKLRRTKRARAMIDALEAAESELALEGWTRRRLSQATGPRAERRRARQSREPLPLLALMGVPAATVEVLDYEYQILVTSRPRLPGGVACQQHPMPASAISPCASCMARPRRAQIERAVNFLQHLLATAEQLSAAERWRRILRHIFPRESGPAPLTRDGHLTALPLDSAPRFANDGLLQLLHLG